MNSVSHSSFKEKFFTARNETLAILAVCMIALVGMMVSLVVGTLPLFFNEEVVLFDKLWVGAAISALFAGMVYMLVGIVKSFIRVFTEK